MVTANIPILSYMGVVQILLSIIKSLSDISIGLHGYLFYSFFLNAN